MHPLSGIAGQTPPEALDITVLPALENTGRSAFGLAKLGVTLSGYSAF
jgi:hypothetical protein